MQGAPVSPANAFFGCNGGFYVDPVPIVEHDACGHRVALDDAKRSGQRRGAKAGDAGRDPRCNLPVGTEDHVAKALYRTPALTLTSSAHVAVTSILI